MGLSYPDIVQSVIDKVTIKGDIFQSTSSKVLQCNITLLAILAKRTKNRTMFIQVNREESFYCYPIEYLNYYRIYYQK
jgi:hypothetical protein